MVFDRALLQSLSSVTGSLGGPMSPLPLILPYLSSDDPVGAGTNLLPFCHTSSLSAALAPSGVEKPEPLRLKVGASGSGAAEREGLLDRQSLIPSATLGKEGARSPEGPSNRRREESRESCRSGSGPSRRQGFSNFASSSNPPPKAPRSFARKQ